MSMENLVANLRLLLKNRKKKKNFLLRNTVHMSVTRIWSRLGVSMSVACHLSIPTLYFFNFFKIIFS